MSLRLRRISNLVLLAIFIIVLTDKSDGAEGWELKQIAESEPIEVIIADRSVLVRARERHWSAVARYPDWKVTMFNTNSKLRYDMKFSVWKTCSVLNYYGPSYIDARKSKGTIPRLKVLSRSESGEGSQARVKIVFASLGEKIGGGDWHGLSTTAEDAPRTRWNEVRSYTCTYAPSLCNQSVNSFLLSLTATPEGPGVPLEYIVNLKDGSRFSRLLTRSKRKVIVSAKDFAIPCDLAYAKTFFETLVPEGPRHVETMFEDLNLGRPFGSDTGKSVKQGK
jgi:hypothetical protein